MNMSRHCFAGGLSFHVDGSLYHRSMKFREASASGKEMADPALLPGVLPSQSTHLINMRLGSALVAASFTWSLEHICHEEIGRWLGNHVVETWFPFWSTGDSEQGATFYAGCGGATFSRGSMRLRRMLEGRAPWEVEAYGCFGLSDDADGQAILAMIPWQGETGTTARGHASYNWVTGETDHHFVWQTSL